MTPSKAPAHAVEQFRNNRFGMFVHYGLYSILNHGEWVLYDERIPIEEYRRLMARFQPAPDAIENWVQLAKSSGMRYMCLTTRHHDGFCLFDTKASEFNVMHSAAGRDLVREFVETCRANDIRPTLYYSVGDWSDPAFPNGPRHDAAGWRRYVETVHTQLTELMSNYGPIDYLFYDGCPPPETWDATALHETLRRLQPDLLISDRCGLDEDVASSEKNIQPHQKTWECCTTTSNSWGCNVGDIPRKPLRALTSNLSSCMHNGGNLLLNLGPLADGSIVSADRDLIRELGAWAERNREAVFGTEAGIQHFCDRHCVCYRDHTAYVMIINYHGPDTVLGGIGNRVERIRVLATGDEIAFRQDGDRLFLNGLPREWPDVVTVLALDLDGPPQAVINPYASKKARFD